MCYGPSQAKLLSGRMSTSFETFLHRLKSGVSTVELVYVPHDSWPLRSAGAERIPSVAAQKPRCRISVLDSSFNPPTLAHRALANVSLPASLGRVDGNAVSITGAPDFDARLLLLSVRNADKALKPTDATYKQRLDMMVLLAKDLMGDGTAAQRAVSSDVAVAIIDEPTFVGKSRILQDFLQKRITFLSGNEGSTVDMRQTKQPISPSIPVHGPRPQLTFVVGIDTLERILSPRYYPSEDAMRIMLRQFLSEEGDDSHLICARRTTPGLLLPHDAREENVMRAARDFIDTSRVTLVEIGEKTQGYSSSEIRQRLGSGNRDDLWKMMVTESIAKYIEQKSLYSPSDQDTQVDSIEHKDNS